MTTSEFVTASLLKATGKKTTLTSSDPKWQKVVAIANDLISQWESEVGVDWNSLYDPEYVVGVVTETDEFEFDSDEVRKISDAGGDCLKIYHPDDSGNYAEFTFVSPDQLKSVSGNIVAQIGNTIRFKEAFEEDSPLIGGTITMPIYGYASRLEDDSSVVPVDIPRWLVVMTAAEYVRNDITKQNQYGNLVQEANQIMQRMIDDNQGQVTFIYRPWTAG